MLDSPEVTSPSPIQTRSTEARASQISWWAALLTLAVLGICLFSGLGAIGLVGPDEPRYMAIARSMLQSGDWVTPRLFGQPWFEKPVLYYWAAAAGFRVFGVGEFAARLPSALSALLASLAMAWAALRFFSLDTAWLTLLLMPTTMATFGFARAGTPDMLFSSLLAVAAVTAAEILGKNRPGTFGRFVFGAALGLATLAKGPAAVILAAGAVALWAVVSGQWRAAFRLLHPVCIAAFAAVALPWYILCTERNPDFFRVFILEHNFSRYLTPEFSHMQPFWYFGQILLIETLPWTALLIPLAVGFILRARADRNWRDSPALFLGCWVIFVVLFFSLSQSKLPGYVLPAVPPLILLVAAELTRLLESPSRWQRCWVALAGCSLPVLVAGSLLRARHLPGGMALAGNSLMLAFAAGAIIAGITCLTFVLTGHTRLGIAATAASVAALLLATNLVILPRIDPFFSSRAAAKAAPQQALSCPTLSTFNMTRSWDYGLEFYLDRPLPEWTPATPTPTWVWTTEAGAVQLRSAGKVAVIQRISPDAWLVRIDSLTAAGSAGRS